MRFTKTLAYETLAKKTREGEGDILDKFFVIEILRDHFGLHGLTGEIAKIDEDSYRLPDILIKTNPRTCIELEGEIHGNGEQITKRDKDITRDEDYKKAGYNLILIFKQEKLGYTKQNIIDSLIKGGLVSCK